MKVKETSWKRGSERQLWRMILNLGTIWVHLGRVAIAKRAKSIEGRKEEGAEAEKKIGWRNGRREVEVEKEEEAEARKGEAIGARKEAEKEAEVERGEGGAERKGVIAERDGEEGRWAAVLPLGREGAEGKDQEARAEVRKNQNGQWQVESGHHLLPLVRDCLLIYSAAGPYWKTELGLVIKFSHMTYKFVWI